MNIFILYKIFLFILIHNYTVISWKQNIMKKIITKFNNKSNTKNDINSYENQYIISSKKNKLFRNNSAKFSITEQKKLNEKKLITISPGGFKGFYLLGILSYIKEQYNTDNIIYSGASAGSWNALFMCYKGDSLNFAYNLLDSDITKAKTIPEIEMCIKYKILKSYKDEDFDLTRLFIGVTTFQNFVPVKNIFTDFENLEDAINCCIASSHIPLITGGVTNRYNNMFTFDGGICDYPYVQSENHILHITHSMWKNKVDINNREKNIKPFGIKKGIAKIKQFSDIFSFSKNNLLDLYDDGYQDAKKHKKYLDTIFTEKINNVETDKNNVGIDNVENNIEF